MSKRIRDRKLRYSCVENGRDGSQEPGEERGGPLFGRTLEPTFDINMSFIW